MLQMMVQSMILILAVMADDRNKIIAIVANVIDGYTKRFPERLVSYKKYKGKRVFIKKKNTLNL
jgi:hypothetical protein